jgi:hypothetical protein
MNHSTEKQAPDNSVATLFMARIFLKQDLAASLNSYEAHVINPVQQHEQFLKFWENEDTGNLWYSLKFSTTYQTSLWGGANAKRPYQLEVQIFIYNQLKRRWENHKKGNCCYSQYAKSIKLTVGSYDPCWELKCNRKERIFNCWSLQEQDIVVLLSI